MADDLLKIQIISDVNAYLARVSVELDRELVQALVDAALHVEGELKQTIMETFTRGGTGQLARNPKATLLDRNGEVKSSAVLLDLVYADIQDRGGVIKPKSVKHLSIPLTQEARVPGKWPRTWGPKELTFIKSKAGNLLLVKTSALKRGQIDAQYVLKKQVKVKGQGYIKRARDAAMAGVREIVGGRIRVAISKGKVSA